MFETTNSETQRFPSHSMRPFRRHRDIDVAGHFAAGPVTRDVGAGRTLGHGDAGHQLLLANSESSESERNAKWEMIESSMIGG